MTAAQSATLHPLSFAAMLFAASDHVAREANTVEAAEARLADMPARNLKCCEAQIKRSLELSASILKIIIKQGPISRADIERQLDVGESTVAKHLNRLAAGRQIVRSPINARGGGFLWSVDLASATQAKPTQYARIAIGIENRAAVLSVLKAGGKLTTKEVMAATGLSHTPTFSHIKSLEADGLVERHGENKASTAWSAVEVAA